MSEIISMNKKQNTTICMERMYVQNVYKNIYKDFSRTRNSVWKCVNTFLSKQKEGQKGIEIGCGNAKNIRHFANLDIVGIDNCVEFFLLDMNKHLNLVCADCCNLPFDSNSFDFALSIACFHHLISYEKQYDALVELKRVLKKNGTGIITLWSVENQKKHTFTPGYNFVEWKHQTTKTVYKRFYNIFDVHMIQEYVNTMKSIGLNVYNIQNENGNWILLFIKKSV